MCGMTQPDKGGDYTDWYRIAGHTFNHFPEFQGHHDGLGPFTGSDGEWYIVVEGSRARLREHIAK